MTCIAKMSIRCANDYTVKNRFWTKFYSDVNHTLPTINSFLDLILIFPEFLKISRRKIIIEIVFHIVSNIDTVNYYFQIITFQRWNYASFVSHALFHAWYTLYYGTIMELDR